MVERVGEREVSGVLDPNPRQLVPAACSLHRRLTHTWYLITLFTMHWNMHFALFDGD